MNGVGRHILLVMLAFVSAGCGGGAGLREVDPADMLARAERSVKKGDYLRAIEDLERIAIDHPGVAFIDDVVFLLGKARLEMKEYVEAEGQFKRLGRDYPFSEHADDAFFLTGECYFRQRGSPQLDPTMAETALATFRRFVDEYPESDRIEEAGGKIQQLREFLAEKRYLNGRQYLRHRHLSAAVIYLEGVFLEFPETKVVPDALFELAKTHVRMGKACKALETVTTIESLPQVRGRSDWLLQVRSESESWECETAAARDSTGG